MACLFCLLFERGRGPRPNSKNQNMHPLKQQKNTSRAREGSCCSCCLGRPGRGRAFLFCCLGGPGRGRVFFVDWAGGVLIFLLFGRGGGGGMLFLLLFGRGTGVHSLTGLPGSALRGPTTKNDQTATKHTHGFHHVPL